LNVFSTIRVDNYNVKSTRQETRRLKAILDKLGLPHIIDDISFHNTSIDLNRMRALHKTNVWKIEKDGSLSLTNRFGHSGRFAYRDLAIKSLIEFNFVDLSILNRDESDFLADFIHKFECIYQVRIPKERQKGILSD